MPPHTSHSFIHSLPHLFMHPTSTQSRLRALGCNRGTRAGTDSWQDKDREQGVLLAWKEVSQVKEDGRPVQAEDRACGYLETQESGATWGPVGARVSEQSCEQAGRGCCGGDCPEPWGPPGLTAGRSLPSECEAQTRWGTAGWRPVQRSPYPRTVAWGPWGTAGRDNSEDYWGRINNRTWD